MLLAAKDIFCIHLHPKVRNIPRNTQLRGRLFDKWPRKGLSGACCGPSGEVSGAPTGRGPACSAARDRGRTGSSEVQTGRAGRRVAKKVFRREDAPAARTQKKCSEGKVRRRPNTYGHKKNGPRSVHFYFCYTTLLLYGLLLRDARPIHPAARQRLRTPGARLFCGRQSGDDSAACPPATARLPSISARPPVGVTAVKASAIRSLSRSAARRSGLSRLAAGISAVRVAPRESLRPPPGSQFSAAGVTAPPRQYGRPPATGESPASSLRRASPARDSTAYRPAP